MSEQRPFVYVALDYDSQMENIRFAEKLAGSVSSDRYGFKVNLDGVLDFSKGALNPYDMVKEIMEFDKHIFADLKMANGSRTMENIAGRCAELGVDIINMYPDIGGKFMKRVHSILHGSNTQLFGLTVLTHFTEADTLRVYGKNLADSVRMFAEMNLKYGADGNIVPGTQLGVVKSLGLPTLVPAIRPDWYKDKRDNDQEQSVTPLEVIEATYQVIGSAVRKATSPGEALIRVLEETS